MDDKRITMAHGNGGKLMRELIDGLFAARLASPLLDTDVDAATVPWTGDGELMVTTDGFTVQPLEFPGGDIGSLAVHGTVNDLAVAGAEPRYLTLNAFLEEGLEVAVLERLLDSMATAARACGVAVLAGDTKVVGRGECGGVYLATTGIGFRNPSLRLAMDQIRSGDRIVLTGSAGDHGAAVLLARQEYGLIGNLRSDADSVLPAARILRACAGLRFMRDPTRGGIATVANEIARATGFTVNLAEAEIPVNAAVESVCEILGFDPYYLACEGRIVAVMDPREADQVVTLLKDTGVAPQAAVIGEVADGYSEVVVRTQFGGERVLEELENEPLPRIC